MTRRKWTIKEVKLMSFYASEGLSMTRAARLLQRSRASIAGASLRYQIPFASDEQGAPWGNQNRKGKSHG